MLCSRIGIAKLIGLGYVAFINLYYKAWSNKIPQDKRLLLHEALVISVIMYDSSCCAALKPVLEKLDVVHRCHLRNTLNYQIFSILLFLLLFLLLFFSSSFSPALYPYPSPRPPLLGIVH